MVKLWIILAAVNGFLAVALGAFGAHNLHDRLTAHDRVAVWQTAVSYQMYHALALLGVAWLVSQFPGALAQAAGWCFLGGILIFSGSLYLLCLTDIGEFGAVPAVGGTLFLVGWAMVIATALRGRRSAA